MPIKTKPGPTAIEIAQDRTRADGACITDFFAEAAESYEPEMSPYFGPISSHNLIEQVLLNRSASPAQLAAAAKDMQDRFFARWEERIEEIALDIEAEDCAIASL